MIGESIRIYYEIMFYAPTTWYFFKQIKESFGLWSPRSKVSTLTSADILKLGFTVWSPYAETQKIDGSTFKNKDN